MLISPGTGGTCCEKTAWSAGIVVADHGGSLLTLLRIAADNDGLDSSGSAL